jgi:hypothetical protein
MLASALIKAFEEWRGCQSHSPTHHREFRKRHRPNWEAADKKVSVRTQKVRNEYLDAGMALPFSSFLTIKKTQSTVNNTLLCNSHSESRAPSYPLTLSRSHHNRRSFDQVSTQLVNI